jgi:hypothetical protein
MINYSSNIRVVVKNKLEQIQALKNNPDPILRTVAMAVLPELKHRVHIQGKDSTSAQIGTYSPGYMSVRTGTFKNSGRFSRGVNKGAVKDAGTFTERTITLNKKAGVFTGEDKVGKARPKYNRTADKKVILSLNRQMENDLSVVPSGNGYGLGYLNPLNYKKALWCEETYRKKILTKLTTGEIDLAKKTAIEFLPGYLKSL